MKNGLPRDYILIKYKGDDKLYLPVDKVDKLYKYSSKDGARPVIHKLNSVEWQKTKMKIRKKIHDISEELIKIYKIGVYQKLNLSRKIHQSNRFLRVNLFIKKLQTN